MTTTIAIFLFLLFLFLSGIHIYWGFGGKWASESVIPTKDDNVKVIMPGIIPSLIVAIGLLFFGILELISTIDLDFTIPIGFKIINKYGLWAIIIIFGIRAIGDFKYIGLFKKIKHTKFAISDTKYYSPLCVIIAVLTLILELNRK